MKAQEEDQATFIDFEDQDLVFNKEIEKVGAMVKELKRPTKKDVFKYWLGNEERKWWKKKNIVHEAKLHKRVGCSNCYDLDDKVMYTVHTGMQHEMGEISWACCTWREGRGHGGG